MWPKRFTSRHGVWDRGFCGRGSRGSGGAGGTTTSTLPARALAVGFEALPPAVLILWYSGSVLPLFNATRITAFRVRTRVAPTAV